MMSVKAIEGAPPPAATALNCCRRLTRLVASTVVESVTAAVVVCTLDHALGDRSTNRGDGDLAISAGERSGLDAARRSGTVAVEPASAARARAAARMSRSTMRPFLPLPSSSDASTPSSRATRRARGEMRGFVFAGARLRAGDRVRERARSRRDSPAGSLDVRGRRKEFASGLRFKRRRLARRDQVADQGPHRDFVALLRPVGRNAQNAGFQAFDILGGFVSFQAEEGFARGHVLAVGLEPADEGPFLHVPAQPRNRDFARHEHGSFVHSAMRSRIACAMDVGRGDDGGFQGRAIRGGREGTVEPADRRVEIVETLVGQLRRRSRHRSRTGANVSSTIKQPAGLGDRAADGLDVEGSDRARIDQLDRDPFLGQSVADLLCVVHHQGQGNDRDVAALANDRSPAKFDLVIVGRERGL